VTVCVTTTRYKKLRKTLTQAN
ncbi:molybdopterin oxidoreductase family protein, partial [Vibrio parahaemolyticus V-223/04]